MGYVPATSRRKSPPGKRKNLVPADEVQDTMNAMMVQAREMCGRILPLPENDYYHCETVRGVSFNASSDFAHRRVLINIDPVLTKQKLKHLVCHEVYPGRFTAVHPAPPGLGTRRRRPGRGA